LNDVFLCIDFGASRVKWVLYSSSNSSLMNSGSFSNPYIKSKISVEISINKLVKQTKNIITGLLTSWNIEKILISSQMHGFALMDLNDSYITDFISWFDQRSVLYEKKYFDTFKSNHSECFYEQTGMNVKSGLPFFNSIPTLKSLNVQKVKIVSLPEIILHGLGVKTPMVHTSILAGTGFFNIHSNDLAKDLIKIHKKSINKDLVFNDYTNECISHETIISKKRLKISIGYGDHQCAVLGAKNTLATTSINLGTGSQVSKIISTLNYDSSNGTLIQYRPYFNSLYLKCITHIPSGRVLSKFINFLDPINSASIWKKINNIKIKELNNSTLKFDLAIFSDAYGYNKEGGTITGINEINYTHTNYLTSLIKSYLNQYLDIINLVETNSNVESKNLILSGGVAKQIKCAKRFFEINQSKNVVESNSNYIEDEAILGLKKIYTYEN
jgi:sugar (pentulose or hexulose) kinase